MAAEPDAGGTVDQAVEWMQSRKRTWGCRMDALDAHLRTQGEQDE